MLDAIRNQERCYLKAVVLSDRGYMDICPMDFDRDDNLVQLDGLYGVDAFGADNNQFDDEGNNTFYSAAMCDIWARIQAGKYRGITANGVAWAVSGNAAWGL